MKKNQEKNWFNHKIKDHCTKDEKFCLNFEVSILVSAFIISVSLSLAQCVGAQCLDSTQFSKLQDSFFLKYLYLNKYYVYMNIHFYTIFLIIQIFLYENMKIPWNMNQAIYIEYISLNLFS